MGLLKRIFGLEEPEDCLVRAQEIGVELTMINHGWTPFHPRATEAERQAAYHAIAIGKHVEWYPPGYEDEPVVTDGKLIVPPEK